MEQLAVVGGQATGHGPGGDEGEVPGQSLRAAGGERRAETAPLCGQTSIHGLAKPQADAIRPHPIMSQLWVKEAAR